MVFGTTVPFHQPILASTHNTMASQRSRFEYYRIGENIASLPPSKSLLIVVRDTRRFRLVSRTILLEETEMITC